MQIYKNMSLNFSVPVLEHKPIDSSVYIEKKHKTDRRYPRKEQKTKTSKPVFQFLGRPLKTFIVYLYHKRTWDSDHFWHFFQKKKSVETVIGVDNEAEVKRDEYEAFCANASEEICDYNISI